jgi:hypothetical protein
MAVLIIAQPGRAADSQASRASVYCGTRQWRPLIEDAANRFSMSPSWLDAVMRVESAGCTHTNGLPTVSSAGAMGLMQLMPRTWQRLRTELHLGEDPFDPHDNILAGAKYLRELYDQFGLAGAITAYHSGPARYTWHLDTGDALPGSTLDYTSRVLTTLNIDPKTEAIVVSQSHALGPLSSMHRVFVRNTMSGRHWTSDPSSTRRLFIGLKHRICPQEFFTHTHSATGARTSSGE